MHLIDVDEEIVTVVADPAYKCEIDDDIVVIKKSSTIIDDISTSKTCSEIPPTNILNGKKPIVVGETELPELSCDDLNPNVVGSDEHNSLDGLQGGEMPNEYYHLRYNEYVALIKNNKASEDNPYATIEDVENKPGIVGPQGPIGPIGPQGIAGENGADGDIGPQGPQGSQGAMGSTGPQGPRGEEGLQGIQGETGLTGLQGERGLQGVMGDPGPQGARGEKGEKGDTGDMGPQGVQGLKGDQGSTGPQGSQGSRGETGAQGSKGEMGITGPQGVQGPIGPTGVQGAKGETGDIGPQGSQGSQGGIGPQGAKGAQGEQGASGTGLTNRGNWLNGRTYDLNDYVFAESSTGTSSMFISLNDSPFVSTIPPKDDPANWVEFTAPKGEQGDEGPQGPAGVQGATGPQGAQGSTGANGQSGVQGAQGDIGPKGDRGFQGEEGPQGPAGPQGNDGTEGLQGPPGQQGIQGNQGPQGPKGEMGTQGPIGPQGLIGMTGEQGNQGPVGERGEQGIQGVQGATGPQGPQGADGSPASNLVTSVNGKQGDVVLNMEDIGGYQNFVTIDTQQTITAKKTFRTPNATSGNGIAPIEVIGGNGANVTSGTGTVRSGDSGSITIRTGNAGRAASTSPNVTNIGGSAGDIILVAGDGGMAEGGLVNLPGRGGNAILQGGTGFGAGIAGGAEVKAGNNDTGVGGDVYLTTGYGSGGPNSDVDAGNVYAGMSASGNSRGKLIVGGPNIDLDGSKFQVRGTATVSEAPILPTGVVRLQELDTKANKNGSNATGTWPIAITGNAAFWSGQSYNSDELPINNYIMAYGSDGKWHPANSAMVNAFLGNPVGGETLQTVATRGNTFSSTIARINLKSTQTNGSTFGIAVGHNAPQHLSILDGSTQRLVINQLGNVGIGTANPTDKFEVNGAIKASDGTLAVLVSYSSVAGVVGTGTNHDLELWTNSSAKMFITKAGSVGIGVRAPTTKLDVDGVITATGGNSTQWNAKANANGSNATGLWPIDISGVANKANLWNAYDDSTSANNNLLYGMGYNSVTNKWSYFNAANWRAWLNIPSSADTLNDVANRGNKYSNIAPYFQLEKTGVLNWFIGNIGATGAENDFTIHSDNVSDKPFTIQNATGNVGIGMKTPVYKLDVAGETRGVGFRLESLGEKWISFGTAGITTFLLGSDGGTNGDTDFRIYAYKDNGDYNGNPLRISRLTNEAWFGNKLNANGTIASIEGNSVQWSQAYAWGNHANLYPSRALLGNGINSIRTIDTRNVNPTPSTDLQNGTWFDFKSSGAIGLTGQANIGPWAGVITLVPYGDDSGNNGSVFRFAQSSGTGNKSSFFGQSYENGVWKPWYKFWTDADYTASVTVSPNTVVVRNASGDVETREIVVTSAPRTDVDPQYLLGIVNATNQGVKFSAARVKNFLGLPSTGETLQSVAARGDSYTGAITIGGSGVNTNTTKLNLRNSAGITWSLSSGVNEYDETFFGIYSNPAGNLEDLKLNIHPNGNIGIGVANSAYKLHVNGDFASYGADFGSRIRMFASPENTLTRRYYLQNNVNEYGDFGIFSQANNGTGNRYDFLISNTGNIGIGLLNPTAKLEVVGTIRSSDKNVLSLLSYTGSSGVIGTESNHALDIWTNSSTKMRILPNGNVGIDVNTPLYKLHVNGEIAATNLVMSGAAGTYRELQYRTGTILRWDLFASPTPESGGNAGSDFAITRYADDGTYLGQSFSIQRSDGTATFEGKLNAAGGNSDQWNAAYNDRVTQTTSQQITGRKIFSGGTGNTYNTSNVEIQGDGTNNKYPTIGFHQPGVNGTTLSVRHDGKIYFNEDRIFYADRTTNINNGSDGRDNSVWFDYKWADVDGLSGSVINFSGLGGGYSLELFGSYGSGGNNFFLRTRNGDSQQWNTHRRIWTSGDFVDSNVISWNNAASWGNHATAGYVTAAGTQTVTGSKTFTQPIIGVLGNDPLSLPTKDYVDQRITTTTPYTAIVGSDGTVVIDAGNFNYEYRYTLHPVCKYEVAGVEPETFWLATYIEFKNFSVQLPRLTGGKMLIKYTGLPSEAGHRIEVILSKTKQ